MDKMGTADVSSYLLFEATGDSEALSDPIMDHRNVACQIAISDDDAHSCCYDPSETCNVGEVINGYESDDEKKEDEDEVEVCVYGTSYYEDDDEIQEHHKPSVSVDSGPEMMDEMERSRIFWEACLAS